MATGFKIMSLTSREIEMLRETMSPGQFGQIQTKSHYHYFPDHLLLETANRLSKRGGEFKDASQVSTAWLYWDLAKFLKDSI